VSATPSLVKQGLLIIRQSFILVSKEERGTHKATSKLEHRLSLTKEDLREQHRH
jgi:hypothetical protein